MRRMLFTAVLLVWSFSSFASGESLRPKQIESFFITPETDSQIAFRVETAENDAEPLSGQFRVFASDGETLFTTGTADVTESPDAGREWTVTLRLPAGFWELEFLPENDSKNGAESDGGKAKNLPGRRFGVVALPAAEEPFDEFFAIDGALSWLVGGDADRASLLRIARRSGIEMVRERLRWGDINRSEDVFDWESGRRYETLRNAYQSEGVKMLEIFHDAPEWLGRVGKYPDDLNKTSAAFEKIGEHWRGVWSALEVWNEPEISFGDNLPGDQYAAVWKAVYGAVRRNAPETTMVSGVVSHDERTWLDAMSGSGGLAGADAFSFHTYNRAPSIEAMIGRYRDWLKAAGDETLPLWITECGRPWKIGPERPVPEQDIESACDIIMKGIEARACGVARYFPFVYPYYEERENNFGMMDRRGSPLRAFAAYAEMIRVLSRTEYVGDYSLDGVSSDGPEIHRARLFRRGNDAAGDLILALYTGKREPTRVTLPFAPKEIISLTGEAVPLQENPKTVEIHGGLIYLRLSAASLENRLIAETPAKALWLLGQAGAKRSDSPQAELHPMILRYRWDAEKLDAEPKGYRFRSVPTAPALLSFDVFNLSEKARPVRLVFDSAGKNISFYDIVPAGESTVRPVEIPPRSRGTISAAADFNAALGIGSPAVISVKAVDAASGETLDRLSLAFWGEPTIDAVLAANPEREKIDIAPALWLSSAADGGKVDLSEIPDGVKLGISFAKENDRWAYPNVSIPEITPPERMKKFSGVLCRVRVSERCTPRFFLYEREGGGSYFTAGAIVPADGRWHTVLIRRDDLSLCSATGQVDKNSQFDPEEAARFSFGLNTKDANATMEIADLYFLF